MTMPVFTIKAKDQLAIEAVSAYRDICIDEGLVDQAEQVELAIDEMVHWRARHEDLVQLPDHKHVPAAPSAPSEPVPDGPRVWAMPELPEDVSAVRDRNSYRWIRCRENPALWCYVSPTLEHSHLRGAELLTSFGPLTEVVEEATP